jgi:flagellar motility protein MotE (MotC chaperone)
MGRYVKKTPPRKASDRWSARCETHLFNIQKHVDHAKVLMAHALKGLPESLYVSQGATDQAIKDLRDARKLMRSANLAHKHELKALEHERKRTR